mgnify:CR=1 FL=1
MLRPTQLIERVLAPRHVAHAHCDLFCGVYDPAQAKIEAMSCLRTAEKYHASDDEVFRARCIAIKEERAELVKHDLFWRAIRAASAAKKTMDVEACETMVDLIDEVSDVFWQTEKAKGMGVYPPA